MTQDTTYPARGIAVLLAIGCANMLVVFVHFGLAAAAPQLRTELELSYSSVGWLLAAAPTGLMLGTYAWGALSDAIGERRALGIAFALSALLLTNAARHAQPDDVPLLGASILAAGIAGSAAHSAGGRAIVEAFPARVHGKMLAIRHTFIPIGGALGGVAMPALLDREGLGYALNTMAACALAVSLLVVVIVPSGRTHRAQRRAARQGDEQHAGVAAGISPLRVPRLWLLAGSCSTLALTQLALVSFLTIYLVDEVALGVAVAGSIFAGAQVVGAGARILMGALADRIDDPFRVLTGITLTFLACIAGALLARVLGVPALVSGLLLALGLLVGTSWNGVAVAAAARCAVDGRMGATLGMQTTTNALMGVLAPVVVGAVLVRASWTPVLGGALVVLAIGVVGMRRLRATS